MLFVGSRLVNLCTSSGESFSQASRGVSVNRLTVRKRQPKI